MELGSGHAALEELATIERELWSRNEKPSYDAALALLNALLPLGVLYVITAPEDPAVLHLPTNHPYWSPTHPRHFVVHKVVKIEVMPQAGWVSATTAEGDRTIGPAAHVLKKVTETYRADVADREARRIR